jgi:hypothetical protein
VRQRITRGAGDECLFRLEPVFVDSQGKIDLAAAVEAVASEATGEAKEPPAAFPGDIAFKAAREHLEGKASLWDWEDDVEFIGLSWTEFV